MKIGMRVLSFCHYLQGPAASQYLADMGADVVKIEPLGGAFERRWSGGHSSIGGVSAFLLSGNRNKRSLAIDLKHPDAAPVMDRLIAGADVVLENFRAGVLDRLGYGYEAVKAKKPDIVYASATGLGASGPDAHRPGQDLLMQARSGLVSATGSAEAGPTIMGAAVVDQHGAALLAMGILGAYVRRLQTGEGARVEASLLQAGIDLQAEALAMYFSRADKSRDPVPRGPNVGSWYHDAPYGSYRLADAQIVLSMNDPAKLAEALDSDALRALVGLDRYGERERYAAAVAEELSHCCFAELSETFDRYCIWFERVQSYDELIEDRQVRHIGAFTEIEVRGERGYVVSHPIRYDGKVPGVRSMPLDPGCDSRALLAELGFSNNEIDRLAERGVVGVAQVETTQTNRINA